jgi:hypothetical protein
MGINRTVHERGKQVNFHIESKRSWVGRPGLNVIFKLSIWHNYHCDMPDARGWESSGHKYWQYYKFEGCMHTSRTKKEIKQHKIWHERVIRGEFADGRTTEA